jgi:hypothetical protein
MPRPNPPRKRPRRRPPANQRAARADAALTKQTADSAQSQRTSSGKSLTAKTAATTMPAPDAMWARRSYAIMLAVMGAAQALIGILLFVFSSGQKDLLSLFAAILGLNLVSVLAASLLAAPLAKRLAGEQRSLRIIETLGVGMVLYFIYIVLSFIAGAALTAFIPAPPGTGSSNCGTASTVITPVPQTTTASPRPSGTPCPSPSASASPTPTARASASPSASASTTPTTSATAASVTVIYTAIAAIDVIAFVATVYLYPPIYKRLRVRPPPPRTPRGGKDTTDDKPSRPSRRSAKPAAEPEEPMEPDEEASADADSPDDTGTTGGSPDTKASPQ